ncbi:PLP-dependent aminotransferase family protein [Ammoniphilus sp. CFH 90114]|uniref:aminotransferase-like domain-containing protein n=1 Tax=Ammoniphilus sp. CFH 90114 TaxID=2493665 RepID=UPI00100DD014|nr:PLP-dependent aminotransferase family protein [Ammoniphilus sp. CFH 90114]RXT06983.1 PLP-dependent aminotransferase family protein [Ammoniphilus sp. CFH 90114]
MNVESFFSKHSKEALKNDPPGEWMPTIPEGCIRLSSGYPAPHLVPVEEIKTAAISLLEEEKDLPLHYLGSPKKKKLNELIRERLALRGIQVSEKELLITSGACQAIDLIARILIDDQTLVAVEAPTYMEALEIFRNYTTHFISIPVDEHGLQTDLLENLLEERKQKGLSLPRFLYTIPTFQNPTGTTMTEERRKHVLELAVKYNFLILEDDAYGELYFKTHATPLKAMDSDGRVLHVGSLSKVVAPGMRIGWTAAAPEFIKAMAWFKKDLDHPFAQATMAAYLERTDMRERLETLRATYQAKCSVLLSALEEYLPKSVFWYVPEGGYFVWLRVAADTSELLAQALEEGVSYVPGKYFFLIQEEGVEYLRLSFSYADEKTIIEGVKRLGRVLREVE